MYKKLPRHRDVRAPSAPLPARLRVFSRPLPATKKDHRPGTSFWGSALSQAKAKRPQRRMRESLEISPHCFCISSDTFLTLMVHSFNPGSDISGW